MSRILISIAALYVFFGLAHTVSAEAVTNFIVDYTFQSDGSVKVSESLDYDFGVSTDRHGIYRRIKTDAAQTSAWYKKRYVDVTVRMVRMDGKEVPYEVTGGAVKEIKIGYPNQTVYGKHRYDIYYTLDGALSYFEDGTAEFY